VHLGNVPVPSEHPERRRVKQHPGRWVLNHALAQKAAGLDVEIVSQAHRASCDFDCEIEGVTVHFLRTYHPCRHFTFYALDAWRMARFVRSLAPDVVHAHGTEAAYGHAALRSGLPFCITAQGLFFQIIPTLGRPPTWNERFLRWGEDRVLRKTRFVVAKSEYVKDALAKQYPHLDLALIPNTYEPGLDAPLAPRTGHAVAYVGTMDERKGVRYLADAMREVVKVVPGVELHVMGNPKETKATGYAGECLRSLRETLGSRLVLHGRVPSTKLFSILDGCRALVAPSLEEMFGNQLVEGLIRGCHGIVAENTALAENARRFGNATVVPQRDSAAIARALVAALSAPFSSESAESARAAIRDWMSPAAVAAAHETLYERILQSSTENSV
jgi:glycosyltransferase involved in cell wall biosynthesis